MAYPAGYWAELVRSSSSSSLVEDAAGTHVWFRSNSNGTIFENIFLAGVWQASGSFRPPESIGQINVSTLHRWRLAGEAYLPSANGIALNAVSWSGATYRLITVPAGNVAPTCSIETPAQTVDAGATVNLAASDSDSDGTIATRAWTATGGTFADAAIQDAAWTAPSPAAETAYDLTYTVTDDDGATASATVRITVRAATTTPDPPAGNKVTFTIGDGTVSGDSGQLNWEQNTGDAGFGLIPAALMAGDTAAPLRKLQVYTAGINVVRTGAGAGLEAGPRLSDALETFDPAIVIEAGGLLLELPGPRAAGNLFSDASEPYTWNCGTDEGQQAFFTAYAALTQAERDATTVTLADYLQQSPVDVQAGTVSTAAPSATLQAAPTILPPVEAEAGTVSTGAPAASLSAAPDADPVDADFGDVELAAPSASLAALNSGSPRDVHPGTVSTGAPSARVTAEPLDAILIDLHFGDVELAAPSASLSATPDADPVDADFGTVSTGEPTASLSAAPDADPVDADFGDVELAAPSASLSPGLGAASVRDAHPGAVSTGAPTARLSAGVLQDPVAVRFGTVSSGAPSASLSVAVDIVGRLIREAEIASAPRQRIVTAIEIDHPRSPIPVRMVNDTENLVIEGETYVRSRFDARLVDDVERQAPRSEIRVGNVGRDISEWMELVGGRPGGTARIMQVLAGPNPVIEWELTLDLDNMAADSVYATGRLGFDPLLGRPAVKRRYDPQTAPGLV